MEEKKLTDEQDNLIIEFDGYGFAPTITMPNTEEYAIEWKKRLIRVFSSQNAEIERLNDMKFTQEHCDLYKENEWLKAEIKRELADHEEFTKKANEEIERLTEELDLANETIDRNNKRYEKVSIERQKALDRVDYLEDALLEKIRRNEELITAIKQAEQKAVKDTAKEILIPLIDCEKQIDPLKTGIRWSILKGFCKKFDVEV